MAYDLTLSSAAFAASSGFGQSMSAGNGLTATPSPLSGLTSYTIEGRIKTATSGTLRAAFGQAGGAWIGINTDGKLRATYGGTSDRDIVAQVITDGVTRHVALTVSPSGGVLFVDGVQVGTATATDAPTATNPFAIRKLGGSGFDWAGEVDEVAVTSGVKYTANFTPAPVANNQANLIAVWHLDGDGVNSAGLAAPSDTAAPTATAAAVANSTPTIVSITMSEAMDTTFTPAASSVTVSGHTVSALAWGSATVLNATVSAPFVNGEAARTVAYTQPGTNNARDVAGNLLANFSGLAITNNVAAAGDTTPPAFASAQVTNSQPAVILVTLNETLANSIPPNSAFTPSGGRTVTGVTLNGTVASVTVNTAYAYGDAITIAYTQPGTNPRLQDAAGNPTATFAAQSVTNGIAAPAASSYDPTKILFSPYNWDVQAGYAKTINGGAYFKTAFGGTSCTLTFDLAGVLTPYPKLTYRLDEHGPWTTVDLAASIAIAMPSDTAGYANHFLEVLVRSTSEANNRWSPQACAVKLTGVTLDAGKSLALPTALPRFGLYFGDSITEGINTVTNVGDATLREDAGQGWAYLSARALGAECGIVGFGGQGFSVTGGGSVPVFGSTWNFLYGGVARSFSRTPDYIVINQGTNDPAGTDITAAITSLLNAMIAALPSSTKIIALRPFNGAHNAQWVAAIAASSAPARVSYIDTTGWFNTTNSTDSLHPNGFENVFNLAPRTAAAVRGVLAAAATQPVQITRDTMNYADRVQETTTATNTSTILLAGAVLPRRSFAAGFAVGTTSIPVCVADSTGKFESGIYTLTNATTLTRTAIVDSSNGGLAETFGAGSKDVFCTLHSKEMGSFASIKDIPFATAIPLIQAGSAYMAASTVSGPITFTAAPGAVRGALVYLRLIADGVNAPNFSAFREWGGSSGFDNRAGIVNQLQFFYDGSDLFYSASQAVGAVPVAAPDTTAPILTSPTSASTGQTTGSGSVTTNEGNGALYWRATTNATESVATVKAGSSVAVTSTGSKAVTVSGLTASTLYYLHFAQTDTAGNDSARVTSASFTTAAVGDTTAPTLSAPTAAKTGATTATGSVTTNEANGTLYYMTSTNAVESAATVKAGASQAVTATGAQAVSFTGLSAASTLYGHYLHRDAAGNDSTVANSGSFVTDAAGSTSTALRFAQLINMTETSATDPYAYTGGGVNYSGSAMGGTSTTALAADGSVAVTVGNGQGKPMLAVKTQSTTQPYANLNYVLFADTAAYSKLGTVSGTAGATNIVPAAADKMRFTRTGTTLVAAVSKDGGTTFTTIYTWTGVPAGTLYAQILIENAGTLTGPVGVGFA